jgi:gephyrin
VCGVREETLIINLPGSSKGSMENFQILQDQLKHAIDLIKDAKAQVESQHDSMKSKAPQVVDLYIKKKFEIYDGCLWWK